jgi:hypothetical protein
MRRRSGTKPRPTARSWFTEGSTKENFRNARTLGEGWLDRYHIDAAVHELNVNWVAGLND